MIFFIINCYISALALKKLHFVDYRATCKKFKKKNCNKKSNNFVSPSSVIKVGGFN